MEMAKCKQCGTEYEAKRSDSLYCSVGCRVAAKRNKDVTHKGLSVTTANKELIHVTDSSSTQPLRVRPVDPITCQATGEVFSTMHEYQAHTNKSSNTINTGQYKPANELAQHEVNRVPVPGDADYNGCMVEHNGQWVPRSSLL